MINSPDDFPMMGMHLGEVIDNVDPKGIGRVRLHIPGILDESPWYRPLGTGHGYIPQRGVYNIPHVGAFVAVWFHLGEIENGYYLAGPPGAARPDTGSEIPTLVKEQPVASDRHKLRVMETDFFVIAVDDRPVAMSNGEPDLSANEQDPRQRMLIQFKGDDGTPSDSDFIEIDGATRGITISGTAGVRLASDGIVEIDANQIQFRTQGIVRRVAALPKEI